MLQLNYKNIFKVGQKHGLTKDKLKATSKDLKKRIAGVHKRKQQFYTFIDEKEPIENIKKFTDSQSGKFDFVVVLGIGGSALGTICLQRALTHLYDHQINNRRYPKLIVLDNIDPAMLVEVQEVINLKKTLFLVVSKSGNSPEPVSQFLYFKNIVKKAGLSVIKHFAIITSKNDGFLRKVGENEGITIIDHAPVGGRFSVLTSVGLVPASLIGIDIDALVRGGRQMRDRFLSEKFSENIPYQLAQVQYLLNKKGKSISVMMPYSQKLTRFADWYRQLLAESIGKAKSDSGKIVNVGITPVKALGATDQHSQSQLYNEGPNDKLIMFIAVKNLAKQTKIPYLYKDTAVNSLKNRSFNDLLNAERRATESSLTKNDRPNITIEIDKVDAFHLGEMFMLFEASTAFLGELFKINAFDQPGVELSKILTKKYLKS